MSHSSLRDDPVPGWAQRLVCGALVAVSLAGAAAWLLLAVVHVGDGYRVDHGAGVRMALADQAVEGVIFPPLYEDGTTGGTRYLPLPVLAHAGLAGVTGDLVSAGKLVGYLSMLALVTCVVWLLRRLRCPWPVAAVLGVCLLVTQPGLGAAFGMRADALPAALQLAAVAVVAGSSGLAGAVLAALLAAVALGSKLTAVWAPLAIAGWLAVTDRRRLAVFATVFPVGAAALLTGFQVISEGRMLAQLTALSGAGVGGIDTLLTAPNRLVHALFFDAPAAWALVPLGGIGLAVAGRGRDWWPLPASLFLQVPLLLVVFTDIGVGVNQLIDLAALAAVGTGALVAAGWREGAAGWLGFALALVVVYVTATALVASLAPDVRAAVTAGPQPIAASLEERVDAGATVLAEDPGAALALGREPVITDPFMLPRMERFEPRATEDLVDRIDGHEFDLIVLTRAAEGNDEWWRDYHLGEGVIDAIRRSYRADGQADGYHVYVPAPGTGGGTVGDGR